MKKILAVIMIVVSCLLSRAADTKLTDLTETTAILSNAFLYTATNASSAGSRKIAMVNLLKGMQSLNEWSNGPPTSNNIPTSAVTVFGTAPATNVLFDADAATVFRFTITNNMAFMITNGSDGQEIILQIRQDNTGIRSAVMKDCPGAASNRIAFGTDITGLTLTTNGAKTDFIKLIYDSASSTTNYWYVIGNVRGY